MTHKNKFLKGCCYDKVLARPVFPALVQDSVSSQRFDWVLSLLVSADLWKLWFSSHYIRFTGNPIGIFFRNYYYELSISEDIYIMYPNILFLHYQGVEEPCFSPLLLTACSVAAHTAAGCWMSLWAARRNHIPGKWWNQGFIFHSHCSH